MFFITKPCHEPADDFEIFNRGLIVVTKDLTMRIVTSIVKDDADGIVASVSPCELRRFFIKDKSQRKLYIRKHYEDFSPEKTSALLLRLCAANKGCDKFNLKMSNVLFATNSFEAFAEIYHLVRSEVLNPGHAELQDMQNLIQTHLPDNLTLILQDELMDDEEESEA